MTAVPPPDPRLKQLDKLIGSWDLVHKDLNTGEEWGGHDTFAWMESGYFMEFHHEEFDRLKGVMIIGYEVRGIDEKPTKELMGHWFETSSGSHFDYIWEVDDKDITFWYQSKVSGMAFRGKFNDDYTEVNGTWKWPGGGYDLTMKKIQK